MSALAAGSDLARRIALLARTVDVVIQFGVEGGERLVRGIRFQS